MITYWAGASVCLIIISLTPSHSGSGSDDPPRPPITWAAPTTQARHGDKCLEKKWKITRSPWKCINQAEWDGDADTAVSRRISSERVVSCNVYNGPGETRGDFNCQGRNVISVCWTNSTVEHHKLNLDRFTGVGVNIWWVGAWGRK